MLGSTNSTRVWRRACGHAALGERAFWFKWVFPKTWNAWTTPSRVLDADD